MALTNVALPLSAFSPSAVRTNRFIQLTHDGNVRGDRSSHAHDGNVKGDRSSHAHDGDVDGDRRSHAHDGNVSSASSVTDAQTPVSQMTASARWYNRLSHRLVVSANKSL